MAKYKNIFEILIEIVFWIAIFLSPACIFGLISLWLYSYNHNLLAILIAFLGVVSGVYFAEYVRRNYGCTAYMGRILGTPDLWPNEVDENEKNKIEDKKKDL